MRNATADDKGLVIDILTNSFQTNQSVNYIVKQDRKKHERIQALMDYSFEVCLKYGKIFISEDEKGCALVSFPDQKKTNLTSILLDLKLITQAIGLSNIRKALRRESLIKEAQPRERMYYLWFIGVQPDLQGNGIGTKLLMEVLEDSIHHKLPVYLETSTVGNLPWYKQVGFQVYNELYLGYKLYFLKRDIK